MALGLKKSEARGEGARVTALVVSADHPLDNRIMVGQGTRGQVRILVEVGSGQSVQATASFKLDREHWLVTGMEVPVAINPADPDRFEPLWDEIPGIEERVAANDPTLADPLGTGRRVLSELKAAGYLGPDVAALPGPVGELAAVTAQAEATATPDRFKEAIERATQEPAPPGKTRAVVVVATVAATLTDDPTGGHERVTSGKRDAVLAVNVPGRAPYAVFDRGFKRPRDKAQITGDGLPALVSATDPNDVEILWDELPSVERQIGQRISDRLQAAGAGMAAQAGMEQQMMEAAKQAAANPPAQAPAPGAVPSSALGGDMKAMLAQNAKASLSMIKNP
ncbi:MAG: hypothetical protein QOI10_780, partial [Solirubrobacterales bacterium]|nr:hypothetical protein [Solirubrobacterales bacterium]